MYHIYSLFLSNSGHLVCFHVFAFVNNVAMDINVHISP